MFLQRSAAAVARRAAVPVASSALRRSFATTVARRDAQLPDKAADATVQKLSGRPTIVITTTLWAPIGAS